MDIYIEVGREYPMVIGIFPEREYLEPSGIFLLEYSYRERERNTRTPSIG